MDFEYSKIDAGIRIDNYIGDAEVITVPAEIDGLPVTEIGKTAFSNRNDLKEILLPDGLQKINIYAFRNCFSLTSVAIPATVKVVVQPAFLSCVKLEYVKLHSAEIVQEGAFSNCWNIKAFCGLTDAELNKNPYLVEVLADAQNCKCHVMERGVIKYSTTTLGIKIERYHGTYEKLILPAEIDGLPVTEIGNRVFCDGLNHLKPPANCIGAWRDVNELKAIKIPETIKIIGNSAFFECVELEEIELPDSLVQIGKGAFGRCVKLKTIRIPASAAIDKNAFKNCNEELKIIRY